MVSEIRAVIISDQGICYVTSSFFGKYVPYFWDMISFSNPENNSSSDSVIQFDEKIDELPYGAKPTTISSDFMKQHGKTILHSEPTF